MKVSETCKVRYLASDGKWKPISQPLHIPTLAEWLSRPAPAAPKLVRVK